MRFYPVLFLVLLGAARLTAGTAAPVKADPEPPVQLQPFKVRDVPYNSYCFDVSVYVNKQAHLITHLFITAVGKDSDAERFGLQAGDEILKVNGKPVTAMNADFKASGDLFQLLVNRPPGEKLSLEVVTHRTVNVTLTAPIPTPQ